MNSFSQKGFWRRNPLGKEGSRAEFLPAKKIVDTNPFVSDRTKLKSTREWMQVLKRNGMLN